jgi:hypothetical protein
MKVSSPPRFAVWLLLNMTGPLNGPSIAGDYEEIYAEIVSRHGLRAARSWYWSQVLKSLPLFIANFFYGGAAMFRNYLKLAYRN